MSTITESRLVSNGVTDVEALSEEDVHSMKAILFGQMVRKCQSELQSYQSDLYHDADALRRFDFRPGAKFLWGFTASHTSMALADGPAERSHVLTFNDTVYLVEVIVSERGTWGVRWELLKGEAKD